MGWVITSNVSTHLRGLGRFKALMGSVVFSLLLIFIFIFAFDWVCLNMVGGKRAVKIPFRSRARESGE